MPRLLVWETGLPLTHEGFLNQNLYFKQFINVFSPAKKACYMYIVVAALLEGMNEVNAALVE